MWGGASGHTYTLTRQPDGTTDVDVVVVREGKNLKGRVLGIVLGTVGKRTLGKALGKHRQGHRSPQRRRSPDEPMSTSRESADPADPGLRDSDPTIRLVVFA